MADDMARERTRIDEEAVDAAEEQIKAEQRIIDYDTHEYPVEVIVKKYCDGLDDEENELFVPAYQREFIWDTKRQSKFIESVMLGLPIPYLFVADNDGRLEIVDGSQRIRTLAEFVSGNLKLIGLEKLTKLNGFKYTDLELSRQRRFLRHTLRMIELTEKADEQIRRDIFERINTGNEELKAMEKRKGIFRGAFYDFVSECCSDDFFNRLCPISAKRLKREEAAEMILRFFAYSDRYKSFKHNVTSFLSDYLKEMNAKGPTYPREKENFHSMLSCAKMILPNGFAKVPRAKSTPRVRFEALSVGIHLALQENPNFADSVDMSWLNSEDFKSHTRSDASNSRPKVVGRIEYVRDRLLGK